MEESKKYHKLIRDLIPEEIAKNGLFASVRALDGDEFPQRLRLKLLEEVTELFNARDPKSVLAESADVLEVMLSLIELQGWSGEDLEKERERKFRERGGFSKRLLLSHTAKLKTPETGSEKNGSATPKFVRTGNPTEFRDLFGGECEGSTEIYLASAFLSRSLLNILFNPLEQFLNRGGRLFIMTSVMNYFNDPGDIAHIRETLRGSQTRIYFPNAPSPFSWVKDPPAFHVKCTLFKKHHSQHSLLIGSSNFTLAGMSKNIEWNLFS